MKKTIILISGALVLGVGAYIFYKKSKKTSVSAEPQPAPKVTPEPAMPVATTPATTSVAYGIDDIKLEQARAIVKKYTKLSKGGLLAIGGKNRASLIMDAKLKKIGYQYKDGLLKKI